jgi:hypothetical protein
MAEQAQLDIAKVAATKQSYETDALMCQYLALVRGWERLWSLIRESGGLVGGRALPDD